MDGMSVLLTSSTFNTGVGYIALSTPTGGRLSTLYPSDSQRGKPPSRMLDLSCPKALNIKSARGEEKTPCESYLTTIQLRICFSFNTRSVHDNTRRGFNTKFLC